MNKGLTIDVELARPPTSQSLEHKTKRVSLHIPPEPPAKDPPRSLTASTKRLSASTFASSRRTLKYATKGKHAGLELVPQPSDDPEDPLNWPRWRKEVNYWSLLLVVGLIGGMKTAFVSTNAVMAIRFETSYTAVAALTGVPLILSALSGLASLVAARIWGKRPVYLASLVLVFIGSMWNMKTENDFDQCMAARVFQGLGWGAFDTLIMSSIHDTYFEHERELRITIYNVLAIATTWGPPLLGGLATQRALRFTIQYDIINCFWIFAIPLIVFGAPETNFDRAWNSLAQTPATSYSWKSQPLRPRGTLTVQSTKDYLKKMMPLSYSGPMDLKTALEAPRAFVAPTTCLLFLATFLPFCALWGFTQSLPQQFAPMPFMLNPTSLGALMAGPFVCAVGVVTFFSFYAAYRKNFTPTTNAVTLGAGSVLAASGILAFGLEVQRVMTEMPAEMAVPLEGMPPSPMSLNLMSARLSFALVSVLLGFVAAGAYVLDATSRPLIWRSTQFTSSNYGVCLRNACDMGAGVTCWRGLFAGIVIIAMPNTVYFWDGLRSTAIGLGVTHLLLASGVAAAWWFYDEHLRRMDGKVMGLVDLSMLKRAGSFFDTD